ncbi:TPA: hypothetical protein ACMDNU_003486 [Vibrio cholerae]
MAKLKVYGGITYGAEGQFRNVVAATSKSKAASILNITINQMNSWWTETFNKYEVEAGGYFFKASRWQRPICKAGRIIVKSVFVWLKAGAILAFLFLPDQTIQFRCSWFEGGGLTWWPFYTEHDVKSAEATSVLNDIFQGTEGHDE